MTTLSSTSLMIRDYRPIDSREPALAQGRPFDFREPALAQGRRFDAREPALAQGRRFDAREPALAQARRFDARALRQRSDAAKAAATTPAATSDTFAPFSRT